MKSIRIDSAGEQTGREFQQFLNRNGMIAEHISRLKFKPMKLRGTYYNDIGKWHKLIYQTQNNPRNCVR